MSTIKPTLPTYGTHFAEQCSSGGPSNFGTCPCFYKWPSVKSTDSDRSMTEHPSLSKITNASDGLVIETPRYNYARPDGEWTCYHIALLAANLDTRHYQTVDGWNKTGPSGPAVAFRDDHLRSLMTAFELLGPEDAARLREVLTRHDGSLAPLYVNFTQG